MNILRKPLLAMLTGVVLYSTALTAEPLKRISSPNHYQGYSEVLYDGWQLSSRYVAVRDGTRLAVDIIRPTQQGKVVEKSHPVVWMHTPYNRRMKGGKSAAETYPSGPINLVKYGYVVAVVDFRGLYGSFGKNRLFNFGNFVEPAWNDAYDITEWLADQSWSSGDIGMWGCSATGGSQQQAAITMPPALKAIFPLSPNFDAYEFINYGGVSTQVPYQTKSMADMDKEASAVDGPQAATLLAKAQAEHIDDPINQRVGMPFRDSPSAELGDNWWQRTSMYTYIDKIKESGIGVYSGANWDESLTKAGPLLMFGNVPEAQGKLIIGPQEHCRWSTIAEQNDFSLETEQLRFYDYWLKGIDNGLMDEPAVTYYTYNAPEGEQWRQSETWPLSNERPTRYYFSADSLTPTPQAKAKALTIAMGEPAKVNPVQITPQQKGLQFDTAPLTQDLEITGYPVIDLWITSDQPDTDVVAQLLDVAPDGSTRTYQMVGRLRASHRVQAEAPYNNFGLPYHSHLQQDIAPIPADTPVRLEFAMLPMSYNFPAGHKIRLAVSFSNPDGEPGEITVLSGDQYASSILLPVIPVTTSGGLH
ncbi:CocE/NonD family hydrolase [Alteromonas lipolytica]|uniref:Xaa-Pro dipeptidyl-peptidase C-terminal domain-containing protein n=1 Tax=Alteromonas lipolytica TaxID=1856405 RepID=A0A1E8FC70_9ALTE|nr:CocE/NonD family hydrolase [Alteromonas lipolytica]OFI33510.1 hypothetical protein BFC17_04430 [Alteromonas lipolytica]GGF59023.1 peptidase S15 [Alteromonas lipolytica]